MSRVRWGRIFTVFVLIWIAFLAYFFLGFATRTSEAETALKTELEQSHEHGARLESENSELRSLLKELQDRVAAEGNLGVKSTSSSPAFQEKSTGELNRAVSRLIDGPSKEYELSRRRTERDEKELWHYLRDNIDTLLKSSDLDKKSRDRIEAMRSQVLDRHHVILADLDDLAASDGFEQWRVQDSKDLSELMQKRLTALQNPEDCDSAKKLVCSLNKGCGYGCQVHHALYCFIVAYGTERMLVLKSKGWRYNKAGFEEVFLPLSESCPGMPNLSGKKAWPGSADTKIVEMGIIDSVNPRPKFLPPSIPRDLSDRIMRLHGDPIVWWIAQFLKYFLRPQPDLQKILDEAEKAQDFGHPIVGIHVRRTDKVGTEAAFHGVDEYMKYVAEYYDLLAAKNGGVSVAIKRVFVASDDPKVLAECRKKFPAYTFHGDQGVAKSAAVSSRYNTNSLMGVIKDIHLLAQTDYLVCTFSSQVCRIAYEIMQQRFPDASGFFKSLDDIWYYGGQDEHQQEVVRPHKSGGRADLDLEVGDVLGVAGNHWNGFNKGRNHRNNRVGLYPEFKTKEKVRVVDFPTYPKVKL